MIDKDGHYLNVIDGGDYWCARCRVSFGMLGRVLEEVKLPECSGSPAEPTTITIAELGSKLANCKHRGAQIDLRECKSCSGGKGVDIKVFACTIHKECSIEKAVGAQVCSHCLDWVERRGGTMNWAYGITTVSRRFEEVLPRTLASLADAGFPEPRLFIDDDDPLPGRLKPYQVTRRSPNLKAFGNWVLAAWELYIRSPGAERYAIFQDDIVAYTRLREYLEQCEYPKDGYWNLYTFPQNDKPIKGWYHSNQLGKGALALVFSNEALRTLLQQKHFIDRPLDTKRGWKSIDGGVVTAMRQAGWYEYVHNPSLVQHTGALITTLSNPQRALAPSFRGEGFDAMDLVKEQAQV